MHYSEIKNIVIGIPNAVGSAFNKWNAKFQESSLFTTMLLTIIIDGNKYHFVHNTHILWMNSEKKIKII